jgi:hypothetical protein
MKHTARLYLPWPVVSAFLASVGVPAAKAQPKHHDKPPASVERLEGGCLLYRLLTEKRSVTGPTASLQP